MENGEPRPQRPPKNNGGPKAQNNNKSALVKQAEAIVARRKARNQRRNERRKARRGSVNPGALSKEVASYAKGELHASDVSYGKLPAPARIALGIALPGVVPVSRMVSEYADSPTATANPFVRLPAQWSSDSDVLPCFLFRNAERAIVLYDANPSDEAWAYGFFGTNKSTQLPSATWVETMTADQPQPLHIPYALSLEEYEPHGDILLAGAARDDPEARYFWINSTDDLSLTVTMPATPGNTYNFSVDLSYWSPRTGTMTRICHAYTESDVAGGTHTLPLTAVNTFSGFQGSGYYAFVFFYEEFASDVKVFGGNLDFTFSGFEISSNGPCIGHRCAPDYFANISAVSGVRVHACSMRYCNVASVLNLEGQVTVYQAPQSKHWQDFFNYSNLTAAMGTASYDVRNGEYHFVKPTQPEDFDFQSFTSVTNGVLVDCFYPLKEQSAFLVGTANITTSGGRSGFFEFNFGYEYQTSDVWRTVALPTDRLQDWDKAMEIVREMPQYYENPTHVGQIFKNVLSKVGKGVNWGLQKGPKVLGLLNALSGVV